MKASMDVSSGRGGKIVLVDDAPANLILLQDILEGQGYQVQSFLHGATAFTAMQRQAPDLVVLDVNMPEMTGYELCEQIKGHPQLCEVPVIFISAMHETVDIVKGFSAGAADYISKPFQIEEVQARIATHFKLRRALRAEHELLERTLNGAVAAMLELVQATSPALVARSNSLRDIVVTVAKGIGLSGFWQGELAAMLALVGCIAVPDDLFEKAWGGQVMTQEEAKIFRAHPDVGARLLLNIPRLEEVAQIIRLQQGYESDETVSYKVSLGVQLLRLALELDQRIYRNMEVSHAIDVMQESGHFPNAMLEALRHYYPMETPFDLRQVAIEEVHPGMILDEDVVSTSTKALIFKAGMVFTDLWVERLGNFARNHGVQKRVRVRVPRLFRDPRSTSLYREATAPVRIPSVLETS
jgi:CheY-like chemotaxis protein